MINAPAWFNEERFIEAARSHFQSLQQHWDANEMDKIAEFVTPQLLEFLKRERADLATASSRPTSTTCVFSWKVWMIAPTRPSPP